MLEKRPQNRITAKKALDHPFIKDAFKKCEEYEMKTLNHKNIMRNFQSFYVTFPLIVERK